MEKLIFLDIDGVLNYHTFNSESQSTTIDPVCMGNFNSILKETGAKIVLSSAWRYMIHNNAISLKGFQYLLRTHGMIYTGEILGTTGSDEVCSRVGCLELCELDKFSNNFICNKCKMPNTRGSQINRWLINSNIIAKYVILDDLDLGFTGTSLANYFIKTGTYGLSFENAELAIEILNKKD